jgi:lipid-binding SYLF domain-containing protein
MKRIVTVSLAWMVLSLGGIIGAVAETQTESELIVEKSRIVVEEMIINKYNEDVPLDLVKRSSGLAIIPGLIKGGFFVGGSYGKGLVVSYKQGGWSGPAFISTGAGSFGLQFGAESVDLILVIIGENAMNSFMRSKFKLGADVAVAAGPVGAQATAATEILLKGGIYSYSRAKGLFIGISVEGAGIASQEELNKAYWGTTEDVNVILSGSVSPPASGQRLLESLQRIK